MDSCHPLIIAATLALLASPALAADDVLAPVVWVANNSEWRYSDQNAWPGDGWYLPSFDDSSWKSGEAYLAAGEPKVPTPLPMGKYPNPTYYFRAKFTVANASRVAAMWLSLDYDDAFAAYINGRLVATSLPKAQWENHSWIGGPLHNSLFDAPPSQPVFPSYRIPGEDLSRLVTGENQIAVAIKQSSDTSTDAAFMLSLYGLERPNPGYFLMNDSDGPGKERVAGPTRQESRPSIASAAASPKRTPQPARDDTAYAVATVAIFLITCLALAGMIKGRQPEPPAAAE
jgi:hypothetical protein